MPLAAQTSQVNAPYSKIGIGALFSNQLAANRAMGSISTAYYSPTNINYDNPASYSSIKLTTFETALQFNGSWLSENALNSESATGALGYLAFAFPANKYWTTSIGLMPYSSRNYDIKYIELPSGGEVTPIDTIMHRFLGSGKIYQCYWGNGFRYKNLAFGFNLGYLFGNLNREIRGYLPNVTGTYGNQKIDALKPQGFVYNFGLQYDIKLPKDLQLTLGASGNPAINVKASQNTLTRRALIGETGNITRIIDTIKNEQGTSSPLVLPPKLSLGVAISRPGSLWAGFDVTYEQWENYRYLGSVDNFYANNLRFAVGVEVTPDVRTLTKYWKATAYRLGFRYNTGNLRIGDTQLSNYAVTGGVGLPIRKTNSRINIALEVGQSGKVADNVIRETFLIGTVGFTLNDKWFIKPKFD
jgi:hypothetical protein